jgi:hypothetical protein
VIPVLNVAAPSRVILSGIFAKYSSLATAYSAKDPSSGLFWII